MTKDITLGLGLLSIGRTWGTQTVAPPSANAALKLLQYAYQNDIRFFDTAPAYGTSEALLGQFLASLQQDDARLTIATKMGEQWDAENQKSYVDHRYDSLVKSIDASLEKLEKIDVLQLHKASSNVISSDDVLRAFDYARACGILKFGASISDFETAKLACQSGQYSFIQLPFNAQNPAMLPIFSHAQKSNTQLIINRPLAMGNLADSGDQLCSAFEFILKQSFSGVVLSGTSNISHLAQNQVAFAAAQEKF